MKPMACSECCAWQYSGSNFSKPAGEHMVGYCRVWAKETNESYGCDQFGSRTALKERNMHETLVGEIVKACRKRAEQGDCPTVKQPSGFMLEGAILELADGLDKALICGNHIATYRTDRWPDYKLDGVTRDQQCESALRTLGAGLEYDMWCCWSGMMQIGLRHAL